MKGELGSGDSDVLQSDEDMEDENDDEDSGVSSV